MEFGIRRIGLQSLFYSLGVAWWCFRSFFAAAAAAARVFLFFFSRGTSFLVVDFVHCAERRRGTIRALMEYIMF